jgi:hypothetical protein
MPLQMQPKLAICSQVLVMLLLLQLHSMVRLPSRMCLVLTWSHVCLHWCSVCLMQ